MATTERRPAVEGWFTMDAEPALLGSRCRPCGTYAFPPTRTRCPNPGCRSDALDVVPLSRRGRVWSFTVNHYQPPPPYVSPEPFAPYALAAVELAAEKLVVLGQVVAGAEPAVGAEVEVVVEPLYEDAEGTSMVWKWRPVR